MALVGGEEYCEPLDEVHLSDLRRRAGVKWSRPAPERLAAWVADLDFLPAPEVRRRLTDRIGNGDLGYPNWPGPSPLAAPFAERMRERYGWAADPELVRDNADIVQAVQIALHHSTAPGDAVALHTPNYPAFLDTIRAMGREPAFCPVAPSDPERSATEQLEEVVASSGARTLLLVNPHNPTGKVFSRTELERIAAVAVEYDLLVLSDEIYADLVFEPAQHIPFASVHPNVAGRTVTLTSASKTFNLAGLRCAVMHVGSAQLRAKLDAQPPQLFGPPNVLGVEATLAAWQDADRWLSALRPTLRRNRDLVAAAVDEDLPGIRFEPAQATYLAWLDCRDFDLEDEDPASFFREVAGVELSDGRLFGPGGANHVRLNFGTSEKILLSILDRMRAALRSGTVK